MTTYTTITNAEIDQDSPITQPLMTAMRDNPLAIAEGDTTAPGVMIEALKVSAGTTVRISNDGEQTITGTTETEVFTTTRFFQKGQFNLFFEYRHVYAQTMTVRVYVNGSLASTFTTTSSSFVSVSNNFNMTIYGTVRVTANVGSGGSQEGRIRNIRIRTNGEHILPFFIPSGYTYSP